MAVPVGGSPDIISSSNLISPITDGVICRLQEGICKYLMNNSELLEEVQVTMTQLWEENKSNRVKLRKLEADNALAKQRNRILRLNSWQEKSCKSCKGFQDERDAYFRNNKSSEQRIAELEDKCADLDFLLDSAQKEVLKYKMLLLYDKKKGKYEKIPKMDSQPVSLNEKAGTASKKVNYKEPQSSAEVPLNGVYNKKRIRCTVKHCGSKFTTMARLKEHVRNHPEPKMYECKFEGCGRKFYQQGNLHRHAIMHSDNKDLFKCPRDGCGRTFTQAVNLKKHILVHEGVKNFACTFEGCGRSFLTKQILEKHFLIHTGEKPYQCTYDGCGRRFRQSGNLKSHMFVHAGTRKHPCTFPGCTSSFRSQGQLDKHTRIHTGERPFECTFEGCGRRFNLETSLRSHLYTHTDDSPYVCHFEGCGQRFTVGKSLRQHLCRHTGERPHQCGECGRKFIQKCALKKHMETHRDK